MRLTKTIKEAIHAHAKSAYPNECCGLIIDEDYYPCDNVAPNPTEHFEIDPQNMLEMQDIGEIQAIVHSHPNGNAEPSEIDRVQMGVHGVPWVICGFGYHADGNSTLISNAISPKCIKHRYWGVSIIMACKIVIAWCVIITAVNLIVICLILSVAMLGGKILPMSRYTRKTSPKQALLRCKTKTTYKSMM
ncbi:Phage tail assembly protein [Moraxella catarrhalis]|nr:Phage tail assembly protein [Moraxella catarrhalis]